MTIWYYSPPQGFSSEQGLSIIGKPILINYDPPQGLGGSGEPTHDDEDYVLGAERNSTEYVLGVERNSVDYELMI